MARGTEPHEYIAYMSIFTVNIAELIHNSRIPNHVPELKINTTFYSILSSPLSIIDVCSSFASTSWNDLQRVDTLSNSFPTLTVRNAWQYMYRDDTFDRPI
jgi:hypothetical protein